MYQYDSFEGVDSYTKVLHISYAPIRNSTTNKYWYVDLNKMTHRFIEMFITLNLFRLFLETVYFGL